jgi:hypothetical protein
MPVFICYSHENKDFVDRLAANLIKNKTRVWLDRWELQVGGEEWGQISTLDNVRRWGQTYKLTF